MPCDWGIASATLKFDTLAHNAIDTGESYDLLVIGAGMAGLAAAYVYHREKKGRCRVLVLDNGRRFWRPTRAATLSTARRDRRPRMCPPARRVVHFHPGPTPRARLSIAHGGNFELETPEETPHSVKEIFQEVGIDPKRMSAFRDEDVYEDLGLLAVSFSTRGPIRASSRPG